MDRQSKAINYLFDIGLPVNNTYFAENTFMRGLYRRFLKTGKPIRKGKLAREAGVRRRPGGNRFMVAVVVRTKQQQHVAFCTVASFEGTRD